MYTVQNLSKPLNVILTFLSKHRLHYKVYNLLYLGMYNFIMNNITRIIKLQWNYL